VARRLAAGALLGAIALASAGCGDPDLWARFRAERDMWHASREIERIRIQPRLASDADWARAERACRTVLSAFPPERWGTAARLEDPVARDVARQAGRAALALGRLAELRGEPEEALARYETVLSDWAGVPDVALDAAIARAKVYDTAGRTEEAAEAWGRVASSFDPRDGGGHVIQDILEAPRRAAALERELGREREARAVLRAGAERLERLAGDERDPVRASLWWDALADDRAAEGERTGALAARKRALAAAPSEAERERLRLELARDALAAGLPDTSFAALAPLASSRNLETRLAALLQRGRVFAALGRVDSALACWDDVADDHPEAVNASAEARFLRGATLEAVGRWEEARTEYRALAAAYPTHRLAMRAMGRIVEYHARRGQTELARLEGLRAVDALDRLILRQRDEDVQFEARLMRARLLDDIGPPGDACDALTAFWRRYPRSYDGQESGLRAGGIADSLLHDRERAADLYREMEARPIRTAVRERVQARLEALGVKE